MRSAMCSTSAIFLLSGLAASGCFAQSPTPVMPDAFFWASSVPPGWPSQSHPRTGLMLHLYTSYNVNIGTETTPNWITPDEQPRVLGNYAATRAKWLVDPSNPNRNPHGKFAIMIQNFGRDEGGCDAAPELQFNCCFFRPEDRILPLGNEFLSEYFPIRRGGLTNDYRTARSYRHPFLLNSGTRGNTNPPLRWWMSEFVAGYEEARLADPTHIPMPDRWYLDTEVLTDAVPNVNSIAILWHIASRNDIWTTWQVPGYPTGTTLASLYNIHVTGGSEDWGWPASILDATSGIVFGQSSDTPRNRAYAAWWHEICRQAEAAVMDYCAYQPIHAQYPAAKVGNYDEMNVDGQPDRSIWWQDRPVGDNTLQFPWLYSQGGGSGSSVPTNVWARTYMHPLWGANLYTVGGTQRYIAVRRKTWGNVQSPYFYTLDASAFDTRFIQADYYQPPVSTGVYPLEADSWRGTMRLARQTAESIINSGSGGNQSQLIPWIGPPASYLDEDDHALEDEVIDEQGFCTPRQARELLSMLKGKNVPELIWWSKYVDNLTNLDAAWRDGNDSLERVYSTRVLKYKRLTGPLNSTQYTDRLDSNQVTKARRLEYTLKDNGQSPAGPREVNVFAVGYDQPVPIGGDPENPPVLYISRLVVDLTVDPVYMQSANAWEVRVEGALTGVSGPGHQASIKIWSHYYCNGTASVGDWVDAGTMTFTTPLTTDATPRCEGHGYVDTRQNPDWSAWTIQNSVFYDTCSNPSGTLPVVRVMIETALPIPHTAWYDLVQAVPVTSSISIGSESRTTLISDANHDGTLDTLDVIQFLDDLDNESAAADLDLSGALDSDDIAAFIDAFTEGR